MEEKEEEEEEGERIEVSKVSRTRFSCSTQKRVGHTA
jgi:hypothetical protein